MQILGDGFVLKFTPHARGSTWGMPMRADRGSIYPACAGINLQDWYYGIFIDDLPRMRGDQPSTLTLARLTVRFTPHARGSTQGDGDGGVLF